MKQIENMDDIIAELQSEGQVRVKEGQTIDDIINENEQGSSSVEAADISTEELNAAVDKIFAQADQQMNDGDIVSTEPTMEVEEKVMEENMEKEKVMEENMVKEKELKNPMPQETYKPAEVAATSNNPYSYINGPKIVIHESEMLLKTDHEIFQKHDQIFQYMSGNKVLYMIGDFKDMSKADAFYKSTKLMYPDAYILNFNKGVIIN